MDYLKGGGVPVSLETFNGIEHQRACGVAREKLVPVDGCNVENGVWVRVTEREAAALATGLGQSGVWSWIENRFSGSAEEGDIRPEFYLLVDDPAAPTRAHVTLAAARSCDLEGGGEVRGIATFGHATGFMNKNPYPDYARDIELLAEAEGLAYEPNWMGKPLEEPACEGPTM